MYDTAKYLIGRGHEARVYVMNTKLGIDPPFFERQIPVLPLERSFESFFRRQTGLNDLCFPSTALMRLSPWIGAADIWHFHNLHGHFVSLPLLGLVSWTKKIVISPVDQYLTTGHCPYPIECENHLSGCATCPRPTDPWPGLAKENTDILWRLKRIFIGLSRIHTFFHTESLANCHLQAVPRIAAPVIRYGVDLNCYRPMPKEVCAQQFGLEQNGRFTVGLFHSYIHDPRKGIIPIIERLNDLASQYPEKFELLVVGNNSDEVRSLLSPNLPIKTLPFLRPPHMLAQAVNLCDVLLYPTRAENLSLSCLYALACGVPVISYDVGGQREAIFNGVNGFLVNANDYDSMFYELLKMSQDAELYNKLSLGARQTAEDRFDFERYIDDLIDYYYTII